MRRVLCSRIVGARTVFRKDPNLDYDIMSDEEWEEEPEGEDILGNDADDEEGGMDEEDEEDGSFMVAGAALRLFLHRSVAACSQFTLMSPIIVFQC